MLLLAAGIYADLQSKQQKSLVKCFSLRWVQSTRFRKKLRYLQRKKSSIFLMLQCDAAEMKQQGGGEKVSRSVHKPGGTGELSFFFGLRHLGFCFVNAK